MTNGGDPPSGVCNRAGGFNSATPTRPTRQGGLASPSERGGGPVDDRIPRAVPGDFASHLPLAYLPMKMSASGPSPVGPVDAVVAYPPQSLLGQPGSVGLVRPADLAQAGMPRGEDYQEEGGFQGRSRSREPRFGGSSAVVSSRGFPRMRHAGHGFAASGGPRPGGSSPGGLGGAGGNEGSGRGDLDHVRDIRSFPNVKQSFRPRAVSGPSDPPGAGTHHLGNCRDVRQFDLSSHAAQQFPVKSGSAAKEGAADHPGNFAGNSAGAWSGRDSHHDSGSASVCPTGDGGRDFGGGQQRKRRPLALSRSRRGFDGRRTSVYADQIISYQHGGLCPKRVKAAFMSVAQAAGQPFLVMPRHMRLDDTCAGIPPDALGGLRNPAGSLDPSGSRDKAGIWDGGAAAQLNSTSGLADGVSTQMSCPSPWNGAGGHADTEDSVLHMSEVSADESDDEMEDGEVEEAKKDGRTTRSGQEEVISGVARPYSQGAAEPVPGATDKSAPSFAGATDAHREGQAATVPNNWGSFNSPGGLSVSFEGGFGVSAPLLPSGVASEAPSLLGPAPRGALFRPPSSCAATAFGNTGTRNNTSEHRPFADTSAGGALVTSAGAVDGQSSLRSQTVPGQSPMSFPALGTANASERSSSMGRARPVDPRLLRQRKQHNADGAVSAPPHEINDSSGETLLSSECASGMEKTCALGDKAPSEVIRYVSSIDRSVLELKNPPTPPPPGTLPPELQNTCVARGKLPLLLDLDNTLLHAQAASATGCDVRLQDWIDPYGEPELYRFELPCNRKTYYMKLRPHLRTFLKKLEPFYEMSVYTNATQEYADIVIAILDGNRQLFQDRIVARDSGFRGEASENKAVRRLYEGMDKRCIVAFDDRQNIWTDLPLTHVVKAQHYDFFDSHKTELNAYYPPLSNGIEGMTAPDVLGNRQNEDEGVMDPVGCGSFPPVGQDTQSTNTPVQQHLSRAAADGKKPCDWDRHLECMLKLFLHLHAEFFKDPVNANIGAILCNFQQKVLSGVGIFFTGFRKTFSPGAAVADCEERQAELAQRLGAKVYKRFDEEGVTHVVAGKNNTNNMLACKENTKLARVHTLWLYCCEAALARVPESAFDADTLCTYYDNSPPTAPYRDHWVHLAQEKPTAEHEPAHPFPPPESLPVREFLSTGSYSDGATLTSPYEELLFIWRPEKQMIRQLYASDESRGLSLPSASSKGASVVTSVTGTPGGSLCGTLLGPGQPTGQGMIGATSHPQSQRLHA
ncbi:NLI interacting factor family phosphatase [Toxoplasma gondii ME49]|uniref:protein-serine/threonine phosphatase n=1 Tax=Toxoplasma gondii (strain ATCC 50611 / Me49) TaxID=508771 RepID=S8GIR0_TOXGM|nr:NLI interacting factor family phosphatase [Toxoplasma gondii ME49]EPT28354.1 NLI interacting factor family phosphatase [Toxoplasma gondii ME49]|eukprot:XP_002365651.2 NLI interacting factor family phosphatase [Toxoplasma gondii ME49]